MTAKNMRDRPHIFLSHNSANKDYAARLAGALQLAGAHVWFDAWKIRPGDSIPAAINEGLSEFDIFGLLWSADAAASNWVKSEMSGAVDRLMKASGCRLVPIVVDKTPLPPLISHLKYVNARKERPPIQVAKELLGIESDRSLLLAVQNEILSSGLPVREFDCLGPYVCCPKCGLGADKLRASSASDEENDRQYIQVTCPECGWWDGSEI